MRILAIIGLCAILVTPTTPVLATFVPIPLPEYCQHDPDACSHTGDSWNHQSSVSSTSEGGVFTCTDTGPNERDPCDRHGE